jgi:hypothetical protein
MYHLTKQEHPPVGIFFQRFIADLNGIFDTVTESEVTCNVKLNSAEI